MQPVIVNKTLKRFDIMELVSEQLNIPIENLRDAEWLLGKMNVSMEQLEDPEVAEKLILLKMKFAASAVAGMALKKIAQALNGEHSLSPEAVARIFREVGNATKAMGNPPVTQAPTKLGRRRKPSEVMPGR